MNARHLLLSMLVLASTVAHGAAPYKIPARESAQAKQYVVCARVDDRGFGVQYWHNDTATDVGSYAGLPGLAIGSLTTAIVRGFSRSQPRAAASPDATLVYRNRFDYVSDLRPKPHVKTREEVKSDVEIVKAKYRGRKLTQAEKLQYNQVLREAAAGTTRDIWFDTLLPQWLADNGAPLREALHEGIAGVVQLLAKDLPDAAPAEVRSTEPMRRRLPNAGSNRYVSVVVRARKPERHLLPGTGVPGVEAAAAAALPVKSDGQPSSLPSDASAPPRSFCAGTLPPGVTLSITCGSRLASALLVSDSPMPPFFASSAIVPEPSTLLT
jgi:hypothetical protein